MIKVDYIHEIKCPFSTAQVVKIVKTAAQFEKKIIGEVEIIVVSNQTIKKINRRYHHRDAVTDVLSFAWQEDKIVSSSKLGQIYIAYPRIVAQAKEWKVSPEEEFIRMLVHGLLHLSGYDHAQPAAARRMFKKQERIVNQCLCFLGED